jgi:hypothetical protein
MRYFILFSFYFAIDTFVLRILSVKETPSLKSTERFVNEPKILDKIFCLKYCYLIAEHFANF